MVKVKNEHVFPKDEEWIVRHEGKKKTFRFFENREDAIRYAKYLANDNCSPIVTHKYNGLFKKFRQGYEVYAGLHKTEPIASKTIEIIHPIVNNTHPIVETINSI